MTALDRADVKAFYDRFGSKQDKQGFYEDRALEDLIAYSRLGEATHVFEFGCGTGRLAAQLLEKHLPANAIYEGVDLSSTMVDLARDRLQRFGERAIVRQIDGADPFAGAPDGIDRIVTTYVLDLLPEEEIEGFIRRCAGVLRPDGLLSAASLTFGDTLASRFISGVWGSVFRVAPRIVGGCRPIRLVPLFAPPAWTIEHKAAVRSFGVTSEVVVARVAR